ncbi:MULTISPECIES: acylphosphatase [unclassified Lentimicrobium]|uniref:acylphosphatase n=1 Tax=unclassified Lentimicrobium TaxID=2677434 RepID=UPI001551F8CE|nr:MULTISPECIES: acylphosphatase [unclassified Lentimicrobium]NPD44724.1 acylphosphatase [Lentimicrobium sp. S6]NPD83420.1 acylphosphatase [Lentimicrobium sp. L6]
MRTLQIKVLGRVQGVGFRYYTNKRANEFNLKGYVKNMSDGSVYIEAEGENSVIKTFVSWCERGPAWSRVSELKISEIPFVGYESFEIK